LDNLDLNEIKKIVDTLREDKEIKDNLILSMTDTQKKMKEDLLSLAKVVSKIQEDLSHLISEPDLQPEIEERSPSVTEDEKSSIVSSIDGAEMLKVAAGDFLMGSDDGESDEKPLHKVTLEDYYIYKYAVTNSMYCNFLNAIRIDESVVDKWLEIEDDHCHIYVDNGVYRVNDEYGDYPVVCVSWYGADAYSRWAGKKLPTEAEWEKSARGTDGRLYPWGSEWDENKCAHCYSSGKVLPVGSYPHGISPCGLMDMSGNVWEWCSDWYDKDYYTNRPDESPFGPASGEEKVIRGGSWKNDSRSCRCANRQKYTPENRNYSLGFRCVKSLE